MRDNNVVKSSRKGAWFRGTAGFFLSVALITSVVFLTLVGIQVLSQKPYENNASNDLIAFSCHPSWDGEAITIVVNINLTDGMNQDEAVLVANTLFDKALGQVVLHQLKSAEVDELGIWKVELTWGYSTEDLGHWFEAGIDPFNRTIVYNRCR